MPECRGLGVNDFQHEFVRALFDPDAGGPLAAQPGFQVYRNTVMAGCVDALQANFPTVCQFVGPDWFRGAARCHVQRHPPEQPALVHYGKDFADFLAGFEPAAAMPWLADLARADRMHLEALFSADEAPLPASRVASLQPDQLAGARLRPHPSARWAWFDAAPIATLWQRHHEARETGAGPDLGDVLWQAEGLLLVCDGSAVRSWTVGRAAIDFLSACAARQTLAEAAGAALALEPDADLAPVMRLLLQAGAFAGLDVGHSRLAGTSACAAPSENP